HGLADVGGHGAEVRAGDGAVVVEVGRPGVIARSGGATGTRVRACEVFDAIRELISVEVIGVAGIANSVGRVNVPLVGVCHGWAVVRSIDDAVRIVIGADHYAVEYRG